jgi:type II secretory pathway component PulF
MFSRSVSSLQNKAREQRYKDRLRIMENKTMIMLAVTGGGVMMLLLLSVFTMMQF